MVINASNPICFVGGGAVYDGDLALAQTLTDGFVAADGGAIKLLETGRKPLAVFGDLDSLSPELQRRIAPDTLFRITEQDSTDFEKCLTRVSAPAIIAVGFTGARIDHELAALHVLLRFPHRFCLLLAEREVIFLCPPRFRLMMSAGETVSLFPLTPVQGHSTGLNWPIDGLNMAPGHRVGTSNHATGGEMVLDMDAAGMLVLLARDRVADVMRAMLDSPPEHGRWPAP